MYTGKILLSLILLITTKDLVIGQDFYLHENGVTIVCDNAEVGQNWNLDGWWYVKRSIDQITPENARTSCVSGIENMSELFRNEENFNEDISHWDVSSVTNMSFMFSGAREFNQDISYWDVSKVEDMMWMFFGAQNFNKSISDWNVENVKNMSRMFSDAFKFNQDLGLWNVSSVIDMSEMFHNAKDFNQDIGEWNVSNVENMSFMFGDANNFNQNIGLWDVSKVKSMQYMFEYAWNFNSDINNWNVKNVEAMQYMFYHAESFNQPLWKWEISSAKDVGAMFYEAKSFDQDLSNWDLSNVTSTWNMLKNSNISTQNYSKLLIAWAQNDLPNNMLFDSRPLTYNPDAINARNKIKNEFKWDIIDNGIIEYVDSSNIKLTYPENKSSDIPWRTSIRWEVKEDIDYDSVQIQMYSDTDTSVFNIYSVESEIEAPFLRYGVTYNWRIEGN